MKTQLRAVALALILACALPAANILIYEDLALGTSAIPGALTLSGQCTLCTFAADTTDFNNLLTGGTVWDLVILAENNSSSTYSEVAANLSAYLTGGGRIIGQTWVSGGLDTLLEGVLAPPVNATPLNNDGHPVFNGIVGDIGISNPGWGTFTQRYSALGTAVGIGGLGSLPFGIILGNDGRTFLNGPLSDTYTTVAQGEQLLANEINYLLDSQVPEPGTFALLGAGLAFLAIRRKR